MVDKKHKFNFFITRCFDFLKKNKTNIVLIVLCILLLFAVIRDFLKSNNDCDEAFADTSYVLPAGTYYFKERVDTTNLPIGVEINIAFDAEISPYFYGQGDENEYYYFLNSIKLLRINDTVMYIEFTGKESSTSEFAIANVTAYDWAKGWQMVYTPDGSDASEIYIPVQTYSLTISSPITYYDVNSINFVKFNLTNDFTPNTSEQWYNDGYLNGYNDGKAQGVIDAQNANYTDGYSNGLDDGKSQGYNNGYTVGYNDGLSASDLTFDKLIYSVIDAPVKVLSTFLDFDFLGFNIWNFVRAIVGVFLTIAILKLLGDVIRG